MKHFCSVLWRLTLKLAVQFALGGTLYYGIETAFRACRHHSPPLFHTFFLGGGAFLIGLMLCRIPLRRPMLWLLLPILGCGVLTAYEYLFGLYFLTAKGLRIWNYTGCAFEYRGLICLQFSLCWGALMWLIFALHLGMERLLASTPFSDRALFSKSPR